MAAEVKEFTLSGGGESGKGEGGKRTAKRTFRVIYPAVEKPSNSVAVESVSGIPALGDDHPGDSDRKAIEITAVPADATGLHWTVEVTYGIPEAGTVGDDPLSMDDEISFDSSSENEEIFLSEDLDGGGARKPIVNSAGDPFDNLPERTTSTFRMTIEGNRLSFDPVQAASYLRPHATNTASVTVLGITIGEGEAKIISISATRQKQGSTVYWRVRWELGIAPDWKLHAEDRGYRELVSGSPKDICDGDPKRRIEHPWPLNGSGAKKTNKTDIPATLDFSLQPKKDFGIFGWTA